MPRFYQLGADAEYQFLPIPTSLWLQPAPCEMQGEDEEPNDSVHAVESAPCWWSLVLRRFSPWRCPWGCSAPAPGAFLDATMDQFSQ